MDLSAAAATTETKGQACSTADCIHPAAFTTRSKPAWCTKCIDNLLREGGLKAAEPFTGPADWRLTVCLDCGVEAHYKFTYTLDKNLVKEKTCRACYWRDWAEASRNLPHNGPQRALRALMPNHTAEQILDMYPDPEVRELLESYWWPLDRIVSALDKHGFEFIATTVEFNDGEDPVVARCPLCRRISASRMGDFSFGCTCSRNIRSSNPAANTGGRVLLAESDSPALAWWDHERNDEAPFRIVTLKAIRKCHWLCPQCGLRFQEKVNDMTALRPSCPPAARSGEPNGKRSTSIGRSHPSLMSLSWPLHGRTMKTRGR